ncbi:MAG: hypothetical protein AAFR61_17485 [Bacteroidota bacterium]
MLIFVYTVKQREDMEKKEFARSPQFPKAIQIPIAWEGEDNPPELPELPAPMEIGLAAATNAIMGGLNGMIREGARSLEEYQNGNIDQKQYTYRIVTKGSQAAVTTGAKTVLAMGLKEGAKAVAKRMGSDSLKRFVRGGAMTSICFGIVDQGTATYQWSQGALTDAGYKVKTSENVGGTGGAIGGAAIGAMIGSVVPGLGTGAGFLVGSMMGMLGAAGGAAMGKSLGETWFPEETKEETPPGEEEKPTE